MAVVVLCGERAGAEIFSQGGVGGMGEETASEGFDGRLDAGAKGFERAGALFARGGGPAFEPALGGLFGLDA
ncbi:MAG: hypothetical protein NTX50_27510 [Candidatus Sumerlaeota bacterium]|nr:hypothetical protein [Candidatus Sumerlaeota bacterium]